MDVRVDILIKENDLSLSNCVIYYIIYFISFIVQCTDAHPVIG